MQRLFNLDKWSELTGEHGLHFVNPRPRRVRVEVNAPTRATVSLLDHEGEFHFLALVLGRDTLEFNTSGAFSLVSDTPGVMIYTADGDDISSVAVAPVIFTKMAERRARNPELEQLAYFMEQRLARTIQDVERRLAASHAAGSQVASPASPASNVQPDGQASVSGDASAAPPAAGGTGSDASSGSGGDPPSEPVVGPDGNP